MNKEESDNIYLDVINTLKDFDYNQDNTYIYIQGRTISEETITTAVSVKGGYDLMVDMFASFIDEPNNDIGRAMLDAVDIINDGGQRYGKKKTYTEPGNN